MSIWIRSQGKHALINANDFRVYNDNEIYANVTSYAESHAFLGAFLGIYCSEEEALAVLDMIQKAIQKIAKHPDHAPVFQMPEAGFLGGADDDRP